MLKPRLFRCKTSFSVCRPAILSLAFGAYQYRDVVVENHISNDLQFLIIRHTVDASVDLVVLVQRLSGGVGRPRLDLPPDGGMYMRDNRSMHFSVITE